MFGSLYNDAPTDGGGPEAVTWASLGLGAEAEAAEAEAEDVQQTPDPADDDYYEPCGLRSRRRERKRFREKADKRSDCFFCAYAGERNTTMEREEVNVMVEMLRKYTGLMESGLLAEMVADYYARFRDRVNANLRAGETPLPRMTAPTVLEHIRRHHQDPEVKKLVQLEELQEMREELMEVVLERNKRTKRVRPNKAVVDCLEKIIKLEWMVHTKDPSKMVAYSAGARVHSGAGEAGSVVATQGKTLYDFFKRRRN